LTVEGGSTVVEVTRELALDIGITKEQYDTWVEMETSQFLIRLQCSR
jgi:hypothetical protein